MRTQGPQGHMPASSDASRHKRGAPPVTGDAPRPMRTSGLVARKAACYMNFFPASHAPATRSPMA